MALSLAQGLAGMVTVLILYRVLVISTDVETLGLWSLTVGIVAFLRVADFSGGAGLNRLVAVARSNGESMGRTIDTVVVFVIALYAALLLAAFVPFRHLVVATVDDAFDPTARALVVWTLLSVFLSAVGNSQSSAIDGVQRAWLRATVQLCGLAIFLGLGMFLIPTAGVLGMAWAQAAQLGFVVVAGRVVLWRTVPDLNLLPTAFSLPVLRSSIGYGAKLQGMGLAVLVFEPGSRIVINHLGGLETVAVFNLAYRLTSFARLLVVSAFLPLIPEFALRHEQDRAARDRLFENTTRFLLPAASLMFCGTCIVAPFVSLYVLFEISPAFLLNAGALSVAWFVATLGQGSITMARGAGLMRWNIIGQWTTALGSLPLAFVFAALAGAEYAGIGVALAVLVGAVVQIAGNGSHLGISLRLRSATPVGVVLALGYVGALAALLALAAGAVTI
ncbi:MAG TPA: hypothetical protein VMM55_03325 [Thermohalobaculum sp.]|nr:hypothetical protein [Thermohalobaculum sp.]